MTDSLSFKFMNGRTFFLIAWCLAATIGFSSNAYAIDARDFLIRNTRPDGTGTPYRLFVPPQYRLGLHLPLLIFLNGSGQIGKDNTVQITENTDALFGSLLKAQNLERQPLLLAVPQSRWPKWDPAEIAEVTASVRQEFDSDPDRVYLTGLSSGGNAVWETLKKFPQLFAAGVPLCAATTALGLRRIAAIPVWIFHGALDHEVDAIYGDRGERLGPRRIAKRLRSFGGRPSYTEYKDLGHMVWDRAYAEPKLFQWLVAQKRDHRTAADKTAKISG